jgi:23S rRNA pseudouridine2605 synthase
VEREYEVELDAAIGGDALQRLTRGVQLEDGPARAQRVRRLAPARIALTVGEGRKREVRRMLEAVGRQVMSLRRVRYGPIRLGALPRGRWRRLAPQEVAALRRLVHADEQDGE